MAKTHIVYIIGFMGCGKSTAGKKLAALLNWSFIDLDRKIEEFRGKTIAEIFEQNGEENFRVLESKILKGLNVTSNTVVSTGGGTPCYGDNMEYMKKTGLTVYLKMTPGQLRSRLSESKAVRPLIKNLSSEALLGYIEQKLFSREKYYEDSSVSIPGIDLDPNMLWRIVKEKLDS
jgi:shikimate kinase